MDLSCVSLSKNPSMPGRKIFMCLPAGRQSRVEATQLPKGPFTSSSIHDFDLPPLSTDTKRIKEGKKKKRHACKLLVYICFELCLTHNQKPSIFKGLEILY